MGSKFYALLIADQVTYTERLGGGVGWEGCAMRLAACSSKQVTDKWNVVSKFDALLPNSKANLNKKFW
jgi:hypothetical protein